MKASIAVFWRAMLIAGALSISACSDDVVAPSAGADLVQRQDPSPGVTLTEHVCRVDVRARTVACAPAWASASEPAGTIIRDDTTLVRLLSRWVSYDATLDRVTFELRVENRIPAPQVIGMADGDPAPFRAYMVDGPTVTAGTGVVELLNEDGRDSLTAAQQPYMIYAGMLTSGDTSSARQWQFHISETVVLFEYRIWLSAPLLLPHGWITLSPGRTEVDMGTSVSLTPRAYSALGRRLRRPTELTWTSSAKGVATVAGGTVSGVRPGYALVTVRDAAVPARRGTAQIVVCARLDVGEVLPIAYDALGSLCAPGLRSGAQYLIVALNRSTERRTLSWMASNLGTVSGRPLPAADVVAGQASSVLARLREVEAASLAPLMATRRPEGPRVAPAPLAAPPSVGDLLHLNVSIATPCLNPVLRPARVRAVGRHVIVVADTTNPQGGLTRGDYEAIADSVDLFVRRVLVTNFGEASDVDGNQRIVLFYTRAMNELLPAGATGHDMPGLPWMRDLLPRDECAGSNQAELLYLLVPDPNGSIKGNVFTRAEVRAATLRGIAHGWAILIRDSRRIVMQHQVETEESWLALALGDVAVELVFHDRAGTRPRTNLDATALRAPGVQPHFERYVRHNFVGYRLFLINPEFFGVTSGSSSGSGWAFLRYAADRRAGNQTAFWRALANGTERGMANVGAALGRDAYAWLRDWSVAVYADDALPNLAAAYTIASWNYRNIYSEMRIPGYSENFPLHVVTPPDGIMQWLELPRTAVAYIYLPAKPGEHVYFIGGTNGAPNEITTSLIRRR